MCQLGSTPILDSPDLLPAASGQLDFVPPVQWPGSVSFLPIQYIQLEETATASLNSPEQPADVSVLGPPYSSELLTASHSGLDTACIPAASLPTTPSFPSAAGMAAPAALTAANLDLLEQTGVQQRPTGIQQQIAGSVEAVPALASSTWHRFWPSMPKLNASAVLAARAAIGEAGAEAAGGDGGMNGGDDDPGGAGGANRYELVQRSMRTRSAGWKACNGSHAGAVPLIPCQATVVNPACLVNARCIKLLHQALIPLVPQERTDAGQECI